MEFRPFPPRSGHIGGNPSPVPFGGKVGNRYRRRKSGVEEALTEMYLAAVSVRRVEDITQALRGTRVSASTVSDFNQKI